MSKPNRSELVQYVLPNQLTNVSFAATFTEIQLEAMAFNNQIQATLDQYTGWTARAYYDKSLLLV